MLEAEPFAYPFRTLGGHYIYDVNTNKIVKVSEEVHDYFKSGTNELLPAVENEIGKMKEKGFLSGKRIKEILHPASNTLEYILDSSLEKLTLQVTQQCNLRCEYCIYSGETGHYQNRKHNSKKMSFETAKKGLDFFIDHSRDSDSVNIGFYGGEPLLEFDLVKKCIAYAKDQMEGKDLTFTITTNATLLDEDIIKYLAENNIMLTISLDGPREIHNKNRKFAGNGTGSFDKVMENLEVLKRKHADYFKNVLFSVVMDPASDFKCISEFFVNYDIVKDSTQMATIPSAQYSKENFDTNEDFNADYSYEFFKIFLYKLGRLEKKYVSNLNLTYFERIKKYYHEKRTPTLGVPDFGHPGGPCIPGQLRLFMNADGEFYPCERVSEASELMRIGNIEDGLDIKKCFDILNVGKITQESCKNCWAFRYCTQCAAFADDTKSLMAEKRLMECKSIKAEVDNYFRDYCTLLELGYDFEAEEIMEF